MGTIKYKTLSLTTDYSITEDQAWILAESTPLNKTH